jgi:hypothetical protein
VTNRAARGGALEDFVGEFDRSLEHKCSAEIHLIAAQVASKTTQGDADNHHYGGQ